MINDGSTDNSLKIAEGLVSLYNNIRVVSQNNLGLAGARNTGLKNITGNYVMFVDSDDYLENNTLDKVLDEAEKNDLEVCMYRLKVMASDGRLFVGGEDSLDFNKLYTGEEALMAGLKMGSVCVNLYKRSFLEENGLFFTEGITHEDVDFNSRVYVSVKRMMITDICPYVYFWNANSLNRSKDYDKVRKSMIDELHVLTSVNTYIEKKAVSQRLRRFYKKHANSVVASFLIKFIRNVDVPSSLRREFVELAKEKGLYPIMGQTLSWKSSILVPFLNTKIAEMLMKR